MRTGSWLWVIGLALLVGMFVSQSYAQSQQQSEVSSATAQALDQTALFSLEFVVFVGAALITVGGAYTMLRTLVKRVDRFETWMEEQQEVNKKVGESLVLLQSHACDMVLHAPHDRFLTRKEFAERHGELIRSLEGQLKNLTELIKQALTERR
jgi:hypothetical protein